MIESLQNNPFFTGGIWLALLASIGYMLKNWAIKLYQFVIKFFIVSIRVESNDLAYNIINEWLLDRKGVNKIHSFNFATYHNKEESLSSILTLGYGGYFFFENKRLFWINKFYNDKKNNADNNISKEILVISCLSKKKETLLNLINETIKSEWRKNRSPKVYTWDTSHYCSAYSPLRLRTIESVCINKDIKNDIICDLNKFINNKEWYQYTGIPRHRGILLTGPPGNGKTSLIVALAHCFKKDIYCIPSGMAFSDKSFKQAFSYISPNAIIVIEDIDCLLNNQNRLTDNQNSDSKQSSISNLSLSGILNTFDGIQVSDGYILIATTNHPEKLDHALIRPGRIDKVYEIGKPTRTLLEDMCKLLLDNINPELELLIDQMIVDQVSGAEAQNRFIEYKNRHKK